MTTFFEHQKSSFKKNYLRNLIALAATDGHMDQEEIRVVYNVGKNRGLKEWQITSLLNEDTKGHEIFLPENVTNRMNLLYDFMQIVYADGLVNHPEMDFIKTIVERFNLRPEVADHLVDLFQYGPPPATEWKEFVDYIHNVFSH